MMGYILFITIVEGVFDEEVEYVLRFTMYRNNGELAPPGDTGIGIGAGGEGVETSAISEVQA